MKSLKTKVILSAVVLIFALVATIGSTFAWFTVSSTVSASAITLNVTTEESLLIKIADPAVTLATSNSGEDNPSDYSTTITGAQLITAGYALGSWTLAPATIINPDYQTAFANAFQSIDINAAARTLTTLLPADNYINNSNGYVIQLKFWVMTQSTTANLRVNTVSVTGDTGITDVDDAIEGATRLAFTTNYDTTGKIYANPDTTEPVYTYIDYDYEFTGDYAETVVQNTSFNKLSDRSDVATLTSALTALEGVVGDSVASGTVIETLTVNEPELVFVTIYIEGWDVDATNYIIGSDMVISFSFTIA